MSAAATLAFCVYAAVGIDNLTPYIGYFYLSVPFVLVLVIAIGLASATPVPGAVAAATAGALIVIAFGINLGTDLRDNDPGLPAAVATVRDPWRMNRRKNVANNQSKLASPRTSYTDSADLKVRMRHEVAGTLVCRH